MIYQLKVTLKGLKPPIWRRIQVDGSTTFATLHHLIQIAFDWDDYHLHEFRMKVPEGEQPSFFTPEKVVIGNTDIPDDFALFEEKLDENGQVIENYLLKEKDRGLYIYDFGDDWQHDIVLEKILPAEEGVAYPRCVKAMREAPAEDSRGMQIEDMIEIRDRDDLAGEINQRFEKYQQSPERNESSIRTIGDWHKLFENIREFKTLKPWQWLWDDQIIAVEIPRADGWAYCSVLGRAEEEYGLVAYLGNDGLNALLETLEGSTSSFEISMKQKCFFLSLSDREELESEDYQLIKQLGLRFRGRKEWPMMRSMSPGFHPWLLEEDEARVFSDIINQVVKVAARAKEDSELVPEHDKGEWFARMMAEDNGQREWRDGWVVPEVKPEPVREVPLYESEIRIKQLRKKYKHWNSTLELASFYYPRPIQEHKGERPYYARAFLVINQKTGMIVYNEIMDRESYEANLQAALLNFIEESERIPHEVWLESDEAERILRPVFRRLKVRTLNVDNLPITNEVRAEMLGFKE